MLMMIMTAMRKVIGWERRKTKERGHPSIKFLFPAPDQITQDLRFRFKATGLNIPEEATRRMRVDGIEYGDVDEISWTQFGGILPELGEISFDTMTPGPFHTAIIWATDTRTGAVVPGTRSSVMFRSAELHHQALRPDLSAIRVASAGERANATTLGAALLAPPANIGDDDSAKGSVAAATAAAAAAAAAKMPATQRLHPSGTAVELLRPATLDPFPGHLYASRFLTQGECLKLLTHAAPLLHADMEGYSEGFGNNYMTGTYRTAGVMEFPRPMQRLILDLLGRHITPLVETLYGIPVANQYPADVYLVKYTAADGLNHMHMHKDLSIFTFIVLLSEPDDFDHGGTYFSQGNSAVVLTKQGDAVLHRGALLHGAVPVTRGERIVLVGFLNIVDHDREVVYRAKSWELSTAIGSVLEGCL
eukprot:g2467.t1